MFCPKCGAVFVEKEDTLVCPAGEMPLARVLLVALKERFDGRGSPGEDSPLPTSVGGPWFCPGCGVQMVESDRHLRCPDCGRGLSWKMVYWLVERHPHREPDGAWR
jgi:uncharacterized Zn finger protein (UPF0148 family)